MGFYQRYEDTRIDTKAELSSEIDPKPGTTSRFPPGIEPAALTAPDDSSEAIQTDAFAALQSGTTDIETLTQRTAAFAPRFNAEPEKAIGERSQDLGPAELARFRPSPVMPPSLGEQAPRDDEDCPDHSTPMLLSSLGGELPSAVSSHCGETEGQHDKRQVEPTLPGTVPSEAPAPTPSPHPETRPAQPGQSAPAAQAPTAPPQEAPAEPAQEEETGPEENDSSVDTRTESGQSEKGTVLSGILTCAADTIRDLWELVTELLGLAGGGIAAAWEKWGPGWFTDDNADEEFARQIREIRDALEQNAKEGMELLAALHTYFADTLDTESLFSALSRAIQLFYTEDEWAAMARRGRAKAEEVVANFRKFLDDNGTQYAVGYLVCILGSMLLGGALLKVIKAVRRGVPDGGGPNTETPNPKPPTNVDEDRDGRGATTPNGPPRIRDTEGNVSPRWVTPDDPNGIIDDTVPDNGGMPTTRLPGQYDGQTPGEIRDFEIAKSDKLTPDRLAQIDDLVDEGLSGQDLRDRGYDVTQLDRGDRPHPGKQEGDYGYDSDEGRKKKPDYRINGVLFDHMSPETPNSMKNKILEKVNSGQARNFIVRIGRKPGTPPLAEFSARLRQDFYKRDGTIENRHMQVIIIDSRTGRIVTWTNPDVTQ